MAKREQLHTEIDALPEDQLAAARVVVEGSQNGDRPFLGLTDAERKSQQESLRELREELIAEGATPGRYLPELEARAATWPE
jgi:hypothetical protein